jgi:hypothetical protein
MTNIEDGQTVTQCWTTHRRGGSHRRAGGMIRGFGSVHRTSFSSLPAASADSLDQAKQAL